MKKRHEQKLVILSVVLFVLFNAPVLLLFNKIENYFGNTLEDKKNNFCDRYWNLLHGWKLDKNNKLISLTNYEYVFY